MRSLLLPSEALSDNFIRIIIPALLVVSATFVFVAPFLIPDNYSWLSNVISESAAQNITGAWVARSGFIFFGLAVLWLSVSLKAQWARGAYWCHIAFGIFMISTAAFSHKPWMEHIPYDKYEDLLHSFTATAMGFAFSFGVLVRLFQRVKNEDFGKFLDIFAIVMATVLPLIGWIWPSVAGLVQRILFLIAYLWYGRESFCIHKVDDVASKLHN